MTIDTRKCDGCGNGPLMLSTPGVFYEIRGFEETRSGGGANKITGRRRTGNIYCGACIAKMKSGVATGQERMQI